MHIRERLHIRTFAHKHTPKHTRVRVRVCACIFIHTFGVKFPLFYHFFTSRYVNFGVMDEPVRLAGMFSAPAPSWRRSACRPSLFLDDELRQGEEGQKKGEGSTATNPR